MLCLTVQQEWIKVLNAKNWSCLPFNISCNYPVGHWSKLAADPATVSPTSDGIEPWVPDHQIEYIYSWPSCWQTVGCELLSLQCATVQLLTENVRQCETAHHFYSVALICKLEATFSSQVRCHTKCLLFPPCRNFSWGLLCLHHPSSLCKYMGILIEKSQSADSSLWSFHCAPMQYPPPQSGH